MTALVVSRLGMFLAMVWMGDAVPVLASEVLPPMSGPPVESQPAIPRPTGASRLFVSHAPAPGTLVEFTTASLSFSRGDSSITGPPVPGQPGIPRPPLASLSSQLDIAVADAFGGGLDSGIGRIVLPSAAPSAADRDSGRHAALRALALRIPASPVGRMLQSIGRSGGQMTGPPVPGQPPVPRPPGFTSAPSR